MTKTIGQIIKEWRNKNHMNQIEFAEKAHLSKGYVSALESGISRGDKKYAKVSPTLDVIQRVAAVMGIEPEKLVAQMGNEKLEKDPTAKEISIPKKSLIFVYDDTKLKNVTDYILLPIQLPVNVSKTFAIRANYDVEDIVGDGDMVMFGECNSIDEILETGHHVGCVVYKNKLTIARIEKIDKDTVLLFNDEEYKKEKDQNYHDRRTSKKINYKNVISVNINDIDVKGKLVYRLPNPVEFN